LLSNKSKRKWKTIEKREVETIFKAIEKNVNLKIYVIHEIFLFRKYIMYINVTIL